MASTRAEALEMAAEALEGWLEVGLEHGEVPPQPKYARGAAVPVPVSLATAIGLRWARAARGLTQTEAAKLAGVSQQQIAKLERPGANPTVETLAKVSAALGVVLTVSIGVVDAAPPKRRKRAA